MPAESTNAERLKIFKQKITLWSQNDCLCKICGKFVKKIEIHIISKIKIKIKNKAFKKSQV